MKINSKALNVIKNYFTNKPAVAAVYLYGSQARGDAKKNSDIDVALVVPGGKHDFFLIEKYTSDLQKLLQKPVEIQNLKNCSIDFMYRVLLEGRLIVSNDEKSRVSFEEKVMQEYFDMKPSIDEYYKYLSIIAGRGEINVRYI